MKKHGRRSEYETAIAAIVKDAPRGTHLTAYEVYAKARDYGLAVSISTVYRTLQRLKEIGNLNTVSANRKVKYESAEEGPEHDHLICLSCGMTIEFVDERLPNFGESVARSKGFIHTKSRFDILGFCAQCCASDNESAKSKVLECWQTALNDVHDVLDTLVLTKETLTKEQLSQPYIKELLATNEMIKLKLKKALEDCEEAGNFFSVIHRRS